MSITPAEIAIALGVTAPIEDSVQWQQWSMWIADAEMLIETRRAALDVVVPDEAKIDYVVREAVVSQVRRPDDATQVSTTIDDGTISKSYRSGKGRVTILDEWWTLLGLTDPKGAFAFDMTAPGSYHLPWCSLSLGASFCSCGADIAGIPIYETEC